jgi:hypothetical protein
MAAAVEAQNRLAGRYALQVEDPGFTLWENWAKDPSSTDNHGWNGAPFALSSYAVGIRPTQPGFSAYEVIPQLGNFTHISAIVPTVRGNISLQTARARTQIILRVVSPENTAGRVGVPRLDPTNTIIRANGVMVFENGSPKGFVPGLTYFRQDPQYVYFDIAPGTWAFHSAGSSNFLYLPLILY